MKRDKNLPLRGLRPLDSGGIYLLGQISIYMIQSLIILILGFFVEEGGVDINGNKAVSYVLLAMTQIILFVTPLIYCHFRNISFTREMGFKRGISVGQGLLLVPITLLCIVAFMPLSGLFVELMKAIGYDYEMSVPTYVDNAGILILSLFFVAVLPAIGEETMYRAFLAKGLRRFGIIGAFFLSALLFATAHGNLLQLVYQFLLGLVLFTVYFATRSIYASMVVHMLNNASALIINFILFKTTGSENINTGLTGAPLVFASLGVSLLGCICLVLVMWTFLHITKKRQDAYVGDREVDIYSSKMYGKHNKRGTNFVTKYFDLLRYLNYSFEEEEQASEYKIPEEIELENAEGEKNKKYCEELLLARQEKDRRWDRNMLFLALAFNAFLLLVNIVNAFWGVK